jgi:hypothetical protein
MQFIETDEFSKTVEINCSGAFDEGTLFSYSLSFSGSVLFSSSNHFPTRKFSKSLEIGNTEVLSSSDFFTETEQCFRSSVYEYAKNWEFGERADFVWMICIGILFVTGIAFFGRSSYLEMLLSQPNEERNILGLTFGNPE